MEASFENCSSCDARLHDAVKYCPFCGAEQPVAEQTDAVDTPPGGLAVGAAGAPAEAAPSTAPAAAVIAASPAVAPVVKPKAPATPAKVLAAVPAVKPTGSLAVSPKPEASPPPPPPPKPPRPKAGIVVALGLAALVGVFYVIGKPSKKVDTCELAINGAAQQLASGDAAAARSQAVLALASCSGETLAKARELQVAADKALAARKPSKKEDACELAINRAAQQLVSGDAAAARSQAVLALASCSGEARAKARELQVAADKALAALANCERDFRSIASQLGEHRLQSAGKQLNQQDSACVESPRGKALALQIRQGQTAADSAEAVLRRLLANDDAKGAEAGLDQLLALNREQADLATLRQELKALQTASRTAVNNAQLGTASLAAVPEPQAAKPVVAAPANPQHELLQSFLRDAESALSQLKFDAAKTYVESARRVDPNNPQAVALARRIKERELQYLKEETSIK